VSGGERHDGRRGARRICEEAPQALGLPPRRSLRLVDELLLRLLTPDQLGEDVLQGKSAAGT